MAGEALNENCVQATVQHGGGGIMVWGCISTKGMGMLEKVNGRLDGNGYIYILENALSQHVICCQCQEDGYFSRIMQPATHPSWLNNGSKTKILP